MGLFFGYLLGWKLVAPIFMRMSGETLHYRFNGWILLLSALLTLLTLVYSALRPVRRIKNNSPMENVNSSATPVYKTVWNAKRITPFVLAMRFHRRNPHRATITALSMSLSVLVLILVSSLVGLVAYISEAELVVHDMLLTTYQEQKIIMAQTGQQTTIQYKLPLGDDHTMIDNELRQEIEAIAGEENVFPIYYAKDTFSVKESVRREAKEIYGQISEHWKEDRSVVHLQQTATGSMDAILLSIPDEYLRYLRCSETENYTGTELLDGTHVLSLTQRNSYPIQTESGNQTAFLPEILDTGDTVRFTEKGDTYTVLDNEFQESYKVLAKLLGYVPWEGGVQVFVMAESVFLSRYADHAMFALLVHAPGEADPTKHTLTNADRSFRKQIEEVCDTYRMAENDGVYYVNTAGRLDGLEAMQ